MLRLKHWQDAVNAVLGAWLILSPWALGLQGEMTLTANFVIVGAALLAAALGAILVPRAWEEWTEGALGLWLLASPWILGFTGSELPRLNAVVVGAVVLALALWTILSDKDYRTWQRSDRPAQ